MPKEATLTGYAPEDILPSAKLFVQIPGFSVHNQRDNYDYCRYDWDHYNGQKKHSWKYLEGPQVLPPRVEVAFDWSAPTTTFITLETEKTFERWYLFEYWQNELQFGLTEMYAKRAFDNLDERGTILEPETRTEILRRQYTPGYSHHGKSGNLFKPHFALRFSGKDELLVPKELIARDGGLIARPSQLPLRTIGQIDIEASRKRMAGITATERGGGTPDEIDERKSRSVQRGVDHLMKLRQIIVEEFNDPDAPMHLKST